MKSEILKSGKYVNLVFETSEVNPFGVFVIEYKNGNMVFNTMDETEAVKKFEKLEEEEEG